MLAFQQDHVPLLISACRCFPSLTSIGDVREGYGPTLNIFAASASEWPCVRTNE